MNTSHPAPTTNTTAPGDGQPILTRFATFSLDNPRTSVTTRRLSVVAGVLWFGVAASTAAWWNNSENWRPWVGLASLLIGSAAAATAAAAISAAWRGSTESMETPGVAMTLFAICTTVVAFALPLWAVAIAVGYFVFAIEAREQRPGLAMLALAQLAGLAVLLVAEALELGPTDDVGERPLPLSAACVTIAVLTGVGLVLLNRRPRQPAPDQ